ncbi:MAG: BlaI/MecI/CopY family transcriptional regulator [Bacteroidaceae bacterium]|nr:BlaI/MecI/CopY family transcriptional regulator [Bacteroidaceae bacterium]
MKNLTPKEEQIMNLFWEHGAMFVKELIELYEEPKPHFNTVSTYVRMLEEQGYVGHRTFGTSHQYHPLISRAEYHKRTVRNVITKYFNNSYMGLVSSLVKEEEISLDELKELIRQVEESASDE